MIQEVMPLILKCVEHDFVATRKRRHRDDEVEYHSLKYFCAVLGVHSFIFQEMRTLFQVWQIANTVPKYLYCSHRPQMKAALRLKGKKHCYMTDYQMNTHLQYHHHHCFQAGYTHHFQFVYHLVYMKPPELIASS